ncbi:hypothetical protein D910_04990 [Dendroctonus ponderosae]|uniref:Uncharacterized protein n=1 Tax=Dendroctonus ponderosae TaxID=77166 RepID=U4U154_DENPD|nr:hypothetical protein D910_04990 [Dendroctonus ponderosae]KAH1006694.1 hypothetical protein HUJ05_007402 [Dendroctonus ponderosae]
MEKVKTSLKRRESLDLFKDEDINQNNATSTPVRSHNRSEDEDSPLFAYSTQEMREEVDVLWDYSSPKSSKPKTVRKSKKKLILHQSPKVACRQPSNNSNQIKQDLLKLREELKALKAEMAKPDHEESLILSPREEEDYRESVQGLEQIIEEQPVCESDFEDPFDDNMDDQLIMFSQQVENQIQKGNIESGASNIIVPKPGKTVYSTCEQPNIENKLKTNCDSTVGTVVDHHPVNNHISISKSRCARGNDDFNDSFDQVLSQLKDDDFSQITQVFSPPEYIKAGIVSIVDKKPKVFPRCVSEEASKSKSMQNKVQWHRTQSFESYSSCHFSKQKIDEIEKKRLEAIARLEAKKKQPADISDSPLKCSPEEIEKKRLQALAKLEAKRQKDIIEKKKQDALKRREERRKTSASQVKSSLSTRL